MAIVLSLIVGALYPLTSVMRCLRPWQSGAADGVSVSCSASRALSTVAVHACCAVSGILTGWGFRRVRHVPSGAGYGPFGFVLAL